MGADVAPPGRIRTGGEANCRRRMSLSVIRHACCFSPRPFCHAVSIRLRLVSPHDMVRKGAQRGHDDHGQQGHPRGNQIIPQ